MTDITDQDRRDILRWARDMRDDTDALPDGISKKIAAHILATVDAPAPTLSEELRDLARNLANTAVCGGDTSDPASDELLHLAIRAEQIEQERDETQTQFEQMYAMAIDAQESRDKAQAEVERLTAELETETVALEENVAADQQANTQGTLSGSLPDPADVKPGEAWLVQVDGKAVAALRIGNGRWVTASSTGFYVWTHGVERLVSSLVPETDLIDRAATNAAETIANAFGVPAPRQITTRGELNALPEGTVIRAKGELVCERYRHRSKGLVWISTGVDDDFPVDRPAFPVTVLWTPEVAS